MGLFKGRPAVEALDDLLDRERKAILRGDLTQLALVASEKARLVQVLPDSESDMKSVTRLRDKADRNQDLLTATARGVKSAMQRLKAMRAPTAPLKTYDRGGVTHAMTQSRSRIEKRA